METFLESRLCIVEVIGDLPYYVPFPEGLRISTGFHGAEPFQLEFQHFKPARHPDDAHGEGIDDGRGTFIKSRIRILFFVDTVPSEKHRNLYEQKALNLTNQVLNAIRYIAFDHAIVHISEFEHCLFNLWKIESDGTWSPIGTWSERTSYGPFGLKIQATLSQDALQEFMMILNEKTPVNNAWLLILDAKNHNARGDLSRAILDIATALEINIENLINVYSPLNPVLADFDIQNIGIYKMYDFLLKEATGHSLHEKPDLFFELEYIRELRNSIAHKWQPIYKVSNALRKYTKYLDRHIERDGHSISTKDEVNDLVNYASNILTCTNSWFLESLQSCEQ